MSFKDVKRILFNIFRLKDPKLIEIRDYKEYHFSGAKLEDILILIRKFKFNRTYFMERKLKQKEIWMDWNGDTINSSLVWIQRVKSKEPFFLIFDEKHDDIWKRISEEQLAKYLLESDSILFERTMLDMVNEGKGFNE